MKKLSLSIAICISTLCSTVFAGPGDAIVSTKPITTSIARTKATCADHENTDDLLKSALQKKCEESGMPSYFPVVKGMVSPFKLAKRAGAGANYPYSSSSDAKELNISCEPLLDGCICAAICSVASDIYD